MYIAGGQWDGVPGTDRLLAEALSLRAKVLWIDQPVSVARNKEVRYHAVRSFHGETEHVTPTVGRLRIPVLPGFSRPIVRRSTEAIARWIMQSAAKKEQNHIVGVVNASPLVLFPRGFSAPRLLHLTDDWLASAGLMGLSRAHLERILSANIAAADVITAVSPDLARKFSELSGRNVDFLPNGCRAPVPAAPGTVRQPVAVLVGQLNERLDFATLSDLAAARLPVIVIGPRTVREPSARRQLDEFLSQPSVDWRGEVPPREVARVLSMAAVGLTPYTDSEFNRSSFPLKTLEYLACGVPVVATDLPAARWIGSDFVDIAATSRNFVNLVRSRLETVATCDQQREIQASAQAHTWDVRAEKVLSLLGKQQTTEPVRQRAPRRIGSK